MNKIIVAFDGLKFSDSAMQYAVEIAKDHQSHLVGVFLEDITYHSYKIYEMVSAKGVSLERLKELEDKDATIRHESVLKFEKACSKSGINFSVHRDKNIALQELLHESIFADLLIIDSSETLSHYEEKIPSRFMRNLLHGVHCPVLVVPKKYKPVQKPIVLYDGTTNSMQAIKLFAYLFSSMKQLPVKLVCVKPAIESDHLPNNKLVKEWMKRHFIKSTYKVLKGFAEDEIASFIKTENENLLFVTGSYKRGPVSMWFRRSLADYLVSEAKMPVFIAHS